MINNLITKIISTLNRLSSNLLSWNYSYSAAQSRIYFLILFFISLFVILAIKVLVVSSGDYTHSKTLASSTQNHRYEIFDRNDNLLAVNLPIASLFANPKKIIDPEDSIKKLLSIFPDLNKKQLKENLTSNKTFVWIKRDITPKEQEKIYNLGLPGFEFEKEQKRVYIYGKLLSHVIGYVDRDMQGMAGIEKYFDKQLRGIELINPESQDYSIKLSIDLRIQNIVSDELEKTIKKFHAKGGAAIVANPKNGEVLALVSKPDFDPHFPGKFQENELFNIASQGVYEMGSGMKAITMAIGFDLGTIMMHDLYDLSFMKVQGFQIKDYHAMKGWHSVPEIFLKSSNVGVSQIMLEIGKSNLRDYLKKLNLLDKLTLELPEKGRPLFQNYSAWTDLSLVTMSYGYGISESPAHFVQAMIPATNGGFVHKLTLIKQNPSATILTKRVFSQTTSDNMRKLMYLVVAHGTGKKAEIPGYYVGGKTGTANKATNGKYDKDKRISSFFGVMPCTDPEYMIYLVIDEPKGIKETQGYAGGGWTAAPTVGAIFSRIISLFGLPPISPDSQEVNDLINFEYKVENVN